MLSPSPLYNLCPHIFETFSLPSIQWHWTALCQLCCSYGFPKFHCGFPLNTFQPHVSRVYRVPDPIPASVWEDHFALGRFFSLFSLTVCVNVLSRFPTCRRESNPTSSEHSVILWSEVSESKMKIISKNFCTVCLSCLQRLKFNIDYKVCTIYLLHENFTCQAKNSLHILRK